MVFSCVLLWVWKGPSWWGQTVRMKTRVQVLRRTFLAWWLPQHCVLPPIMCPSQLDLLPFIMLLMSCQHPAQAKSRGASMGVMVPGARELERACQPVLASGMVTKQNACPASHGHWLQVGWILVARRWHVLETMLLNMHCSPELSPGLGLLLLQKHHFCLKNAQQMLHK